MIHDPLIFELLNAEYWRAELDHRLAEALPRMEPRRRGCGARVVRYDGRGHWYGLPRFTGNIHEALYLFDDGQIQVLAEALARMQAEGETRLSKLPAYICILRLERDARDRAAA